jgi:hypothetical protein
LIKFKFYQPKRSDFTKISSLVTLEFDLIFYIYFADFYLFWNFETVNSELLLNLDQSNSTSFQRFSKKKKPARFFRTVREHRTKAILKGKSHMSFALCTQHTTLYKAQWKSSFSSTDAPVDPAPSDRYYTGHTRLLCVPWCYDVRTISECLASRIGRRLISVENWTLANVCMHGVLII